MGAHHWPLALAHAHILEMVGEGHHSSAVEDSPAMGILEEHIGSAEVAGIHVEEERHTAVDSHLEMEDTT